jgi:hypothetical protein
LTDFYHWDSKGAAYMRQTLHLFHRQLMFIFITVIGLLILSTPFSPSVLASPSYLGKVTFVASTHIIAQQPNQQSLLLVLLDRSGSLTGAGGTDPDDYSTSVTRALADLWPGKMVVITFPKVNPLVDDQVDQLGPYDLATDSTQRQTLKNKIPEPDPNGNTPLGPAMDAALNFLQKGSVPAGSQAIIITDGLPEMSGDPDGMKEKAHIENDLLSQFHRLGVPIHTFGLKITSPDAQNLLSTIAEQTGEHYTPVQSSTDLAQRVTELCASWLGLQFQSVTADSSGNYAVNIQELTSKAEIIIFRSDTQYPITITAPNGSILQQGVGVIQQSPDTHYQIDELDVTPPVVTGTYSVFVGKDPQAQVYRLVDTRLQVHILAPRSTDVVYTGKPAAQIRAALYDGNNIFTPKSTAVLQAEVTFTTSGQAASTSEVNLAQQDGQDNFIGKAPIYNTPGTLQILVNANYEEIHQQSNTEIVKVEIPPCTTFDCFIERNYGFILGIGILILIIVILFLWSKQREPYGYLVNVHTGKPLKLGTYRPLLARLFKKSMVTMQELAGHPDASAVSALITESLGFVATNNGDTPDSGVSLCALQENLSHISVRTAQGKVQSFSKQQRRIRLGYHSEILKNDRTEVIFQITEPDNLKGMHT